MSQLRFCERPFWQMFVTVDGGVVPCCHFKGVLGNVLKRPILNIWKRGYQRLREAVAVGERPEECRFCDEFAPRKTMGGRLTKED